MHNETHALQHVRSRNTLPVHWLTVSSSVNNNHPSQTINAPIPAFQSSQVTTFHPHSGFSNLHPHERHCTDRHHIVLNSYHQGPGTTSFHPRPPPTCSSSQYSAYFTPNPSPYNAPPSIGSSPHLTSAAYRFQTPPNNSHAPYEVDFDRGDKRTCTGHRRYRVRLRKTTPTETRGHGRLRSRYQFRRSPCYKALRSVTVWPISVLVPSSRSALVFSGFILSLDRPQLHLYHTLEKQSLRAYCLLLPSRHSGSDLPLIGHTGGRPLSRQVFSAGYYATSIHPARYKLERSSSACLSFPSFFLSHSYFPPWTF